MANTFFGGASEGLDKSVPEEYHSFWKSRNTEMGDAIKGLAMQEYKAAASGPDAAKIRQGTAEAAAQAGALGQAGASEAAAGLMGAGTGAVSPGRAQALMQQTQQQAQEGTAKAAQGIYQTEAMIAQRKAESAMATLQQQQQFDRQMAEYTMDRMEGYFKAIGGFAFGGGESMATAGAGAGGDATGGVDAGTVAAVGTAVSDIRLKENIAQVGHSPSGIPMYEFNYIGEPARYSGAMAQDLLETHPHAVTRRSDGYYAVYYDQIDVAFDKISD